MTRKQPPALYPPRRQSVEALAREDGEAADIALGSAKIAKRAAESMPKPDPREDVNYQRLSGLEESFWARISPRRNRWPELRVIDERLVELDRRQNELIATLAELRGRFERAGAEYADALAAWMAAGESEPKPVSEARTLEEAISEAEAEYAAIDNLRTRVLEERIEFVAKHRKRLVRDAERETEKAKAHYLTLIEELERAREELVGVRETAVWAALFPSEALASMAPTYSLAGGFFVTVSRGWPQAPSPPTPSGSSRVRL